MLTPIERIMKARMALIMGQTNSQPFFGLLSMNLKLKEDINSTWTDDFGNVNPTFMVDGETLFFHPEAPDEYSDLEMKSVVGHEVFHLASKHHVRLAGRDPRDWNKAADYVTNQELKAAGFIIPDGWLLDDKFKGLSVDEIYAKIHKKGKGKGKGKGSQKSKQQPQQSSPNPAQGRSTHRQPGQFMLPPNPDPKANRKNKPISGNDLKKEDKKWSQLISKAKSAVELNCGSMSANIKHLVDETLKPKMDWRSATRDFLDRVCYNDYTWTRPNMRYIQSGFILPTLYNKEVGRIALVIDTSISLSNKDLNQFGSEAGALMEEVHPEEVAVFYVDTRLHGDPEIYTMEDLPLKLEMRGRGGTAFSPAFNWIRDNADKYDDPICLIYLTDLGSHDYPKFIPDYPVLWVNTRERDYSTPPFGEIVYLNR